MKKVTKSVLVAAVAAIAMFSCTRRELVTPAVTQDSDSFDYGRLTYSLSIQVQPGATAGNKMEALVGAIVSVNAGGSTQSKTVDASGVVVFEGLPEGSVNWVVNPGSSSYATVTGVTTLDNVDRNNVDRNATASVLVKVPTMNATLSGRIIGDFDFNTETPEAGTAGVNVRLSYTYSSGITNTYSAIYLQPSFYLVQTSADGSFSIANVPALDNTGGQVSASLEAYLNSVNAGQDVVFSATRNVTNDLQAGRNRNFGTLKANPSFLNNATITGSIVGDFDFNPATADASIAGVFVTLQYTGAVANVVPTSLFTTRTDANGRFVFPNVPAFISGITGNFSITAKYETLNGTGQNVVFGNGTGGELLIINSANYFDLKPNQIYSTGISKLLPNLQTTGTVTGTFFGDFNLLDTYRLAVNNPGSLSTSDATLLKGFLSNGFGLGNLPNASIPLSGFVGESTFTGAGFFSGFATVVTTPGAEVSTVNGNNIIISGNQTIVGYVTVNSVGTRTTVLGSAMDINTLLNVQPNYTQFLINNNNTVRQLILSNGTFVDNTRATSLTPSSFRVAGVTVRLRPQTPTTAVPNIIYTATTNADGEVVFPNLPVSTGGSTYIVETTFKTTYTRPDGLTINLDFDSPVVTTVFVESAKTRAINGGTPVRVNYTVF